jgi:hypothetical protein
MRTVVASVTTSATPSARTRLPAGMVARMPPSRTPCEFQHRDPGEGQSRLVVLEAAVGEVLARGQRAADHGTGKSHDHAGDGQEEVYLVIAGELTVQLGTNRPGRS